MPGASEEMLLFLKQQGFELVLIWMLSIAIVYGILTRIKMPESVSARGVISIAVGFLILLASVGTNIPSILSSLIASMIVVGFVLLMIVIFLELLGIKSAETVEKHAGLLFVILSGVAFLIFLSSGASKYISSGIALSESTLSLVMF